MPLIKNYSSAVAAILLILTAMTNLTTSAPAKTNTTSPTLNQILAVSPANIVADQCPTPPTEFLPYPPPPGYQPGPGCAPASQGTQPSENNPPAGFYGGSGSGSGSGSSTQYTSSASSVKGRNPLGNPLGKVLNQIFSNRRREKAVNVRRKDSAVVFVEMEEADWTFDGMTIFGSAAEGEGAHLLFTST